MGRQASCELQRRAGYRRYYPEKSNGKRRAEMNTGPVASYRNPWPAPDKPPSIERQPAFCRNGGRRNSFALSQRQTSIPRLCDVAAHEQQGETCRGRGLARDWVSPPSGQDVELQQLAQTSQASAATAPSMRASSIACERIPRRPTQVCTKTKARPPIQLHTQLAGATCCSMRTRGESSGSDKGSMPSLPGSKLIARGRGISTRAICGEGRDERLKTTGQHKIRASERAPRAGRRRAGEQSMRCGRCNRKQNGRCHAMNRKRLRVFRKRADPSSGRPSRRVTRGMIHEARCLSDTIAGSSLGDGTCGGDCSARQHIELESSVVRERQEGPARRESSIIMTRWFPLWKGTASLQRAVPMARNPNGCPQEMKAIRDAPSGWAGRGDDSQRRNDDAIGREFLGGIPVSSATLVAASFISSNQTLVNCSAVSSAASEVQSGLPSTGLPVRPDRHPRAVRGAQPLTPPLLGARTVPGEEPRERQRWTEGVVVSLALTSGMRANGGRPGLGTAAVGARTLEKKRIQCRASGRPCERAEGRDEALPGPFVELEAQVPDGPPIGPRSPALALALGDGNDTYFPFLITHAATHQNDEERIEARYDVLDGFGLLQPCRQRSDGRRGEAREVLDGNTEVGDHLGERGRQGHRRLSRINLGAELRTQERRSLFTASRRSPAGRDGVWSCVVWSETEMAPGTGDTLPALRSPLGVLLQPRFKTLGASASSGTLAAWPYRTSWRRATTGAAERSAGSVKQRRPSRRLIWRLAKDRLESSTEAEHRREASPGGLQVPALAV
ncbi:hypothetical protein CMUS01_05589 [Colletotrichum musicola]|uniref:Uncharacterized protein n=1 Tax=Colletotrichum musicola TaxID=2175873 RepID=A0A8H6NJI7_9PEZI|nr:hypothetical protein CMUS01_05589 [Colletotrichum musicola]